jgi:hypothetical protein
VDTAALLGRWTPAELIGFARRLDPGLDTRDLADVASRLDQMPTRHSPPLGSARKMSPGCGSGSRAGPEPDPARPVRYPRHLEDR